MSKWFSKGEADERQANSLRKAWSSGSVRLFSPSLVLFEVANSIWKNPNIPNELARSLVKTAVNVSPTLVNPGERVVEQAMLIARKTALTFYDAVYLALAKSLSFPFITADHKQLSASDTYVKSFHISELPEIKM